MNAFEAYKLFVKKIPLNNKVVIRCFEYNSMFTFELGRSEHTNKSMLGSVYCVDKQTGKVGVFQPFDISLVEYNAGKEVKNFK